jgi:radical SAM protein (TIGR01212 family)
MKYWDNKPYHSLSHYYKSIYGEKIYKISLSANVSCPNRDGTLGTKGCIFCSEGGSGDFAQSPLLSITKQIELGKKQLKNKAGNKYIAYFQSFTNTYGNIDYLESIFTEALHHEDIVGIAIGTRPDCLAPPIIDLLSQLNQEKKVWIELGLQTIHETTADYINRGYKLSCFNDAVARLHAANIDTVVHLIIGLPGETREDLLDSIHYIAQQPIQGVKLHLLHILKKTGLESEFLQGNLQILEMDDYINLVIDCIERLPSQMVIHRLTGDGPKEILLAPLWSGNKKHVLNQIHKRFKERNTYQGKLFYKGDKNGLY